LVIREAVARLQEELADKSPEQIFRYDSPLSIPAVKTSNQSM
jgi:hypothetical protein